MKKEDVPQDPGSLGKVTKEVCYATDDTGKYTTELSQGWEVKAGALDVAWKDIAERVAAAKEKVLRQEASPLLYFMELKLMDIGVLAGYTGFWKWQVRRHLRPAVFKRLSERKLRRYAEVFEVPVSAFNDLNSLNVHED
ncbi:MAG TPA: hypothetical protein VFE32_08935 [Puia sp.]|jgi:hypothetical protein|nr:hypothetical protein [Puia sp.]